MKYFIQLSTQVTNNKERRKAYVLSQMKCHVCIIKQFIKRVKNESKCYDLKDERRQYAEFNQDPAAGRNTTR